MKHLPATVTLFLYMVFSAGLVYASSKVELNKVQFVDTNTKEKLALELSFGGYGTKTRGVVYLREQHLSKTGA